MIGRGVTRLWTVANATVTWLHPRGVREVPAELRSRPFTAGMARDVGVTSRRLQGGRFVRLFHDVYVAAELAASPDIRIQAIALCLPAGAVVAGSTAAWLYGVDVRPPGEPAIDVVLPRLDQMRRPGVRARSALVEAQDVQYICGVPVLSPVRVAFDFARGADLVEAVVGVDAMVNRGGCDRLALMSYIEQHRGWRGVRYAEETVRHVEPESQSPMESRQRMALVLAGLPRPEAQISLFEGSSLMAVLDNGYRRYRVGADYDGEPHRETWLRDNNRQEWIHEHGWWHRRYNVLHARAGWRAMIRQVGDALVRRGWRPGDLPSGPPANPKRLRTPYGRWRYCATAPIMHESTDHSARNG